MRKLLNVHFLLNLVKHYWKATRVDVLHSPFVFDLYMACIGNKDREKDLADLDELRRQLRSDSATIIQEDYGAGEAQGTVKQKSISEFSTRHAKSRRFATIIYRLVKHYRHRKVIELGTSVGLTACYIGSALKSLAAAGSRFVTIEGAPEVAMIAKRNVASLGLKEYVEVRVGRFDDILPALLPELGQVDLVFIDGNHRYGPTMSYFNLLLPYVHNNTMIVLDDIYWSPEMTKAWEEIKTHPRVMVTIDLFFIGIVLFRKEQAKQDFQLRVF